MAGLSKVKGSGLATGAATASLVGIDDNATSTAITIDASENLTLAAGGTTYGKIGSSAGTYIASVACGLRLHSGGTKIFPTDANGGALPNAVDLGAGGGEWKDLYLSGNVKMASGKGIDFSADANATGATSEVLDDYEEGTWTPTTSTGTMTFNAAKAVYTKIGNLVTISVDALSFSDITSTNGIVIGGLPFTSSASNKSIGAVISNYNNKASTISHMSSGRLTVEFYQSNATGTWVQDTHSSLNNTGNNRHFTISYVV